MSSSLAFRSASALVRLLKERKVGSEELLDIYLTRQTKYHPRVNAIIAMDIPAARQRARAADEATAKGESWGPLHGLPITIKDSLDVAGMPSTWGLPDLKDHRPAK